MLTLPGMPVLRLVQVEVRRSQHDRRQVPGCASCTEGLARLGAGTCAVGLALASNLSISSTTRSIALLVAD